MKTTAEPLPAPVTEQERRRVRGDRLTPEELHAWLDRKPPPGSWRDFGPITATGPLDLGLKEALTGEGVK